MPHLTIRSLRHSEDPEDHRLHQDRFKAFGKPGGLA